MADDNVYEMKDKFQMNPELKKKFEQIKTKIDKFKKEVVKKHKEIIGIALLPNVSPLRFSSYMDAGVKKEEKLEEEDKEKINLLIMIDDGGKKNMFEMKHTITKSVIDIAKDIDNNFLIKTKLVFEIKEDCFDARYEFLQLISLGAIFYDPNDFLAALKVSEIHKNMVIKKFDKYISSYIAAGSLFRGDKKSFDIDVYIIVDDTDVKRMSRYELKERLRGIILSYGAEAARIAGVKKQFHVQTYILTEFWEAVKDAHPVIFTFIRDGVPLYDKGMFTPWRLLLKMGKIKPSPEAIDMQMDVGEKMLERTRFKLLSVVGEDLYYAILNPAQAALMLYGVSPPTPRDTISLMRDIFVKREKIFLEKHVKLLEDVFKFYKGIEHGKLKEISGKQIDDFLTKSKDYLKAIRKLFDNLQKKKDRENVDNLFQSSNALVKDLLSAYKIDGDLLKGFSKLVRDNEVPKKYLETFKKIKEAKAKRLNKAENDKIAREARMFLKSIAEFIQRKREFELERVRVRIKYGNKYGDVFIFDNVVFIIEDIDAKEKVVSRASLKSGKLKDIKKSSMLDFEKFTKDVKIHSRVFVKDKLVNDLKGIFGKDIEIMIGY